ncbi:hypothetical protein ACPPVO_42760 [Dactylosporangium sp. McL0621]|uniref:hypothetical protein n=1 Tax=Dactylosporangium sp. McL0621 TaxID=3415678 RepID=UPI003CEA38A6
MTFRRYATEWLASARSDQNTRDRLEREFRLHVYPVFGDRPMSTVQPATAHLRVGPARRRRERQSAFAVSRPRRPGLHPAYLHPPAAGQRQPDPAGDRPCAGLPVVDG